jgi:hypothetical protein
MIANISASGPLGSASVSSMLSATTSTSAATTTTPTMPNQAERLNGLTRPA